MDGVKETIIILDNVAGPCGISVHLFTETKQGVNSDVICEVSTYLRAIGRLNLNFVSISGGDLWLSVLLSLERNSEDAELISLCMVLVAVPVVEVTELVENNKLDKYGSDTYDGKRFGRRCPLSVQNVAVFLDH